MKISMRIRKPEVGYKNMRKLTSTEAKQLKFNHKILSKLMIMTEETGKISFWFTISKTKEVSLFSGSDSEYFDANKASTALEHFWAEFNLL